MSVNPTQDRPFTDNEKRYLEQFSWGKTAIDVNEAKFGAGEQPSAPAKHRKNTPAKPAVKQEEQTPAKKPLIIIDPDTSNKVSIGHGTFEQVKSMQVGEVKEVLASLNLPTDGHDGTRRARLAIHLEGKG